jgi:allantoin racemase
MKIKVIYPTMETLDMREERKFMSKYFSEGTEFDIQLLDYGSISVESEYDVAMATPDILTKIKEAEENGYDGVFVSAFDEIAVQAGRELVDIPVIGAFEATILTALGLADKLCIIGYFEEVIPQIERRLRILAISPDKFTPIRVVNMLVEEIIPQKEKALERLFEESVKAIEEDKAQCIILGCTEMTIVTEELDEKLKSAGYDIPLIDPNFAAIQMLESYIRMGLKQSRVTYAPLRDKKLKWYGDED